MIFHIGKINCRKQTTSVSLGGIWWRFKWLRRSSN